MLVPNPLFAHVASRVPVDLSALRIELSSKFLQTARYMWFESTASESILEYEKGAEAQDEMSIKGVGVAPLAAVTA
jgi:hypothetical protein